MACEDKNKFYKSLLGEIVTVKTGEPEGGIYHARVVGVFGGEDDMDAYILGACNPPEEFTGRVIGAIIHENDNGVILVVAPQNLNLNQVELEEALQPYVKGYNTTIECLCQKSCGAIIFRKVKGLVEYLLLFQKKSQTWSFPKGHMEAGETEQQTALREVREEAGLAVSLIPGFREEVRYKTENINREVVLFLSKATGEVAIRKGENADYRWVDAENARKLLYPEYGEVIDRIEKFLKQY